MLFFSFGMRTWKVENETLKVPFQGHALWEKLVGRRSCCNDMSESKTQTQTKSGPSHGSLFGW